MALNALTLSTTQGVQGRPFQAAISGLTTGRVEVLGDASPGFSVVNGNLMSGGLPYPVSTVAIREYEPGVGQGYRDSRIDIGAVTRDQLQAQAVAALGPGRSLVRFRLGGNRAPDGTVAYFLYVEDDLGATTSVPIAGLPIATILGTALRGYTLSALGTLGLSVQWQARSSSSGAYSDVSLSNPFTIGNGQNGTALVGMGYRAKVTLAGFDFFSPEVGPTGITDSVLPTSSAYHSVGQMIANINTDGAGGIGSARRGIDFYETIRYYTADFGANAKMTWRLNPGVGGGTGGVFCYMHIRQNRYTDDTAASAYSAGVQHSNLSAQPFAWNLTEDAGSTANRSFLIEYFPSDSATVVAPAVNGVGGNRQSEIGWMPSISDDARSYFESAPNIAYPDYVDENGLTWRVRSKAGPTIILSGGRYVVAYPPPGVARMSGSLRRDRYTNWLIAQNVTKGAHYMTGLASGLEIISTASGGSGGIGGQFYPSTTDYPWSGVAATAYSFDTDVAAYHGRLANLNGIEVRKADDAFIRALKDAGLLALLDELWLPRSAGTVDMRRAFKSASYDIVDRTGAATFSVGKGISYAGAGYGGTGFNPATAGGQFQQNAAFMFAFLESDPGAAGVKHIGNATANIGRNTAGTSLSHQLNNATSVFGGTPSLPEGYSIRRAAGATPGGTNGATGYQVKRTGSVNAVFDNTTATSTAPTSAEIEIARAGSGTAYSSAVMSAMAIGGGLTNTQVDTFHAAVLTWRAALTAAGV